MQAYATTPIITPADRLSLTLFFAVVTHAIIILGVGFDFLKAKRAEPVQKLEITLVSKRSRKPVDKADYLAQADHKGSGNTPEKVRAASASKSAQPSQDAKQGTAAQARMATTPQKTKVAKKQKEVMTQKKAAKKVVDSKAAKPRTKATAVDIIKRSMEVASLDVEIQQRHQAYANRPKVKYISASTREFKYATYMEAWRSKVERIGRLNYPEEAKRRKLYGSLLLDVAIKQDGSILDITLQRSSGNKILDDAAINIVRLAAPYAPLPENIRKETDILHIQRTWIFKSGNKLYSK